MIRKITGIILAVIGGLLALLMILIVITEIMNAVQYGTPDSYRIILMGKIFFVAAGVMAVGIKLARIQKKSSMDNQLSLEKRAERKEQWKTQNHYEIRSEAIAKRIKNINGCYNRACCLFPAILGFVSLGILGTDFYLTKKSGALEPDILAIFSFGIMGLGITIAIISFLIKRSFNKNIGRDFDEQEWRKINYEAARIDARGYQSGLLTENYLIMTKNFQLKIVCVADIVSVRKNTSLMAYNFIPIGASVSLIISMVDGSVYRVAYDKDFCEDLKKRNPGVVI